MSDLPVFTEDEIVALTGGLRQPAAQLRKLHELGYRRAWKSPTTGEVVLERAHYHAVLADTEKIRGPGPQLRRVA